MTDRPEQTLGMALRLAREAQGLHRIQLGALLGVSTSAITRWEQDLFIPKADKLIELARHLEVPASQLFELAGVVLPEESVSLPAMLRARYDLPPEAIAEIQATIEQMVEKHRNSQEK